MKNSLNIKKNVLTLVTLATLISCSISTNKEFYMLSYQPNLGQINLSGAKREYPLPYSLEIADFDINRVYDRNAIVIRESLHKLTFDDSRLWAYRPHKAATELLINHINANGLFAECKNEFLDYDADFIINGRINNLEKYQNNLLNFAYIDMDLKLLDKDKKVLIEKHIRRDIKLDTDDAAFFVKIISDLLKEEYGDFTIKIFEYFEKNQ